MKYCGIRALPYLFTLSVISGCLTPDARVTHARPDVAVVSYTLSQRTARSASGCHYDYKVFDPIDPRTGTSVLLGHGFLRDQDNMTGLSRALANTGVRVVTLDFCNMRPWNGHHQRNAQDMRDLARALSLEHDVVYAGFSAGALAALLAADNTSRAILTLDLVDQDALGLNAIASLTVPLIGFSGPDSACNAQGNGNSIFTFRPDNLHSELTQVKGASHCDFETPSDWLCELACGDGEDAPTDKLESDIIVRLIVNKLTPFLSVAER